MFAIFSSKNEALVYIKKTLYLMCVKKEKQQICKSVKVSNSLRRVEKKFIKKFIKSL